MARPRPHRGFDHRDSARSVAGPRWPRCTVRRRDGPRRAGLCHDPHRVGEIDEPRTRIGPRRHLLGQLQHDRHGAQRLANPPAPSSPDRDTRTPRQRLVDVARRLSADAQLDDHEVGPLQGGMGRRPSWRTSASQPRARKYVRRGPDHLPPQIARVEEHEIVERPYGPQHPQRPSTSSGCRCSRRRRDNPPGGAHATQRNIRPCPSPPIAHPPYWPSTGATVPRPMSSSFHDRRRPRRRRASPQ